MKDPWTYKHRHDPAEYTVGKLMRDIVRFVWQDWKLLPWWARWGMPAAVVFGLVLLVWVVR